MQNQQNADVVDPSYTRITEILNPFTKLHLIDREILAKAAERGTKVHDYCELYMGNLLIEEIDENCKNYVNAFIDWFDKTVQNVIFIEKRIYDDDYMITGKADVLLQFKNSHENILLDLKTSEIESKTWRLQTAAYAMMIEKHLKIKVHRRACLKLSKYPNKPAKFIEHFNIKKDTSLFFKSLDLYRFFL